MKQGILVFFLCMFFIGNNYAQKNNKKDIEDIKFMLATQVIEWNNGNVDGFMNGYWDNDSLLFIGAKGPFYGFETTLKKYKETYPDEAHMGKLTSTITQMKQLSKEYFFVVGTWALERTSGNVGGTYTLLLRKVKGKWVIVCDHTS